MTGQNHLDTVRLAKYVVRNECADGAVRVPHKMFGLGATMACSPRPGR